MLKKINDEKGQGLFEFLFFLPFMLMMYQIALSMGNAINGSINQQKTARGYLYARIKNNSTIPTPEHIKSSALSQYGLFFMGWAQSREEGSGQVYAPCYPFKTMIKATEDCKDNYSGDTTQNIRVETVYGVCPTTYRIINQIPRKVTLEDDGSNSYTAGACTNKT